MTISNSTQVNDFLADVQLISPEQYDIALAVRELFLQGADVEEGIKYGGLTFHRAGNLLGGVFTYKAHVSVEFSHGAEFSDECSLLEGKGKYRRHIKLLVRDDIHARNVGCFVEQALK